MFIQTKHDRFRRNIIDVFDDVSNNVPSREALVDGIDRYTYAQLSKKVTNLASHLAFEKHIKKGDRIALVLKNCKEFVIAYYAVLRIGAIAVPINVKLTSPEMIYQLDDCSPSFIIANIELWDRISNTGHKIAADERCIFVGPGASHEGSFENVVQIEARTDPKVDLEEDDIACIMYTSGTTGNPKGATMTHWNVAFNSQIVKFPDGYRYLNSVPLFHASGLNACLNTALASNGTTVLLKKFRDIEAFKLIESEHINFITFVPTILNMMINSKELDRFDVTSIRVIICGGGPLSSILLAKTLKRLPGVEFIQVFGMTESTSRITCMECSQNRDKTGSVGLPLPGIETRILDDNGLELPINEVGELIVRGQNIISKYWNQPEYTKQVIRDGWFHTGDLMKVDDEGHHYIMGRKKEMIIRGGENVYCSEVENAIVQNSKVLDVAVIGVPDDFFGEEVMAFVVLNQTEPNLAEEDLRKFLAKYLADYKIPKYVKFIEELPKNPLGKVLKRKLLELAMEEK